ncbi:phospholipase A2 A2-hormotoxin-Apt1a-like [Pocillopora damicornis]|nr:phospholipase A2 A2-hormotoxin-Apt1a-like [Pocillopora damicornis]
MIRCETGRSAFDYLGYGCYCGLGGKGTPVDGVDRCCQEHDACYDRIINSGICPSDNDVYYEFYSQVGCSGCASRPSNNACELAICKCDSVAARCFVRNTFNSQYEDYPDDQC